ncbi:3-phosphoshikimate 1-carboxyvinyltransferase [Weissella thailandensis]|uniref:3-phosphoshikimate 1-carboxyvinyltransferase n=1 Tax=Weissella thailandensis TaxID=89061 RepID=A0ABX9I4E6_9LACO|nr:3-phosphoshikimate 1-carboxyvinyltransferase [Weissella thailandensis]NKY90934.1 3-phosphoshikimate 1-carboxyvinyltransferase [Weissella thailandensis]RDS59564.1 3-phosphoshikimate 1-carboxyvinyltransferase [Weissella thailandensis]GEP74865.1 3-phosphoshikimate 1-carboxyvinyltransferase [Weissella thailandensis]HJG85171.1 3-phosphoshikimate 1-carboxyvinyltransferase [Weissella thailandensis]
MGKIKLQTAGKKLRGTLTMPGDKSISHRAVMLGSIASGDTRVQHLLDSEDVRRTVTAMSNLGVTFSTDNHDLIIHGRSLNELVEPSQMLDMGNSGTTARLLMGLLANQPFAVTFRGDKSLSKRPFARVIKPLIAMGVSFVTKNDHLPVTKLGTHELAGLVYELPVASAQVKSAIILAALQAKTPTTIIEPIATRDHTERMLAAFGVHLVREDHQIKITPQTHLTATTIRVPGDISSAAFWIVAGVLVPKSALTLKQVGINPTRTGIMKILQRMGAKFTFDNESADGEPMADIQVQSQSLHGTTITAVDVPAMIDEMPLVVLAATQAQGDTVISGASELHVKESDRIATVTTQLNKLGADIEPREDGFYIHGGTPLQVKQPTIIDSCGDHRVGMMLTIAALITTGDVSLANAEAVNISYPNFFSDLSEVID